MPPVPTLASKPALEMETPLLLTANCAGLAADPDARFTLSMNPVPVLEVVSVRLNRLVAAPVAAPHVKVVVLAPWFKARLPEGLDRFDHEVDAPPEQDPNVGAPPAVSTRHCVPAPPAAVTWIALAPLP